MSAGTETLSYYGVPTRRNYCSTLALTCCKPLVASTSSHHHVHHQLPGPWLPYLALCDSFLGKKTCRQLTGIADELLLLHPLVTISLISLIFRSALKKSVTLLILYDCNLTKYFVCFFCCYFVVAGLSVTIPYPIIIEIITKNIK